MSIFDIFKGKSSSDSAEDETIILKKMDIIFEEAISKAEAFEKLGRNDEAMAKYQEGFSRISEIVKNNPSNYKYPLKSGELILKLAYTKDKIFFEAAETMYRLVIKHFSDNKDADLTMAYWRLGLIEERLRNNQETALSFYDKAIIAPKGRKIADYQKRYDLSAVYLSLAILYRGADSELSKQYAVKRLSVVSDCPQAKEIINDFNQETMPSDFDAMTILGSDTIMLNESLVDKNFILSGKNRAIKVRADMLSFLFITAKQSGWPGGRTCFDSSGLKLKFPEQSVVINKEDAISLSAILKQQMGSVDDSSPEIGIIKDILLFSSEGSFEIRSS